MKRFRFRRKDRDPARRRPRIRIGKRKPGETMTEGEIFIDRAKLIALVISVIAGISLIVVSQIQGVPDEFYLP